MLNTEWKIVYDAARAAVNPKKISNQICSGGVGAAVISKNGNVYTGICIDTDCSLGMCAERNAISTMITNREFEVKMVAAVDKKGNVLPPCGACREFMLQLKNAAQTEVLIDNKGTIVRLKDLMPYSYS